MEIDPFIFRDPIVLSWHGFFTFVGVGIAIYLIDRWSSKEEIDSACRPGLERHGASRRGAEAAAPED